MKQCGKYFDAARLMRSVSFAGEIVNARRRNYRVYSDTTMLFQGEKVGCALHFFVFLAVALFVQKLE